MPALLMRTSRPVPASRIVRTAAATLASSVTSSCTKRPPSASAASRPTVASRAPIQTSWPASSRRRAVSRPRPLLAPVIKVVVMLLMLRATAPRQKRTLVPGTGRATIRAAPCAIMVAMDHDELAGCLRTWRDRLAPEDVGLPAGGRRRAPGLRREEVAQLAGLSLDYLARLEQGRASNPSPSVLAPLARALRLTAGEADPRCRVAGQAPPAGRISRPLTPGVQRVLDRLTDVPVVVFDAA